MIDYGLLRAEAAAHPYPLLFATVSGAHLYGFASADSDYDLRGVHVLPVEEAVGLLPRRETVEFAGLRDGVEMDLVTHDVRKFFLLLLKRNGYVLEQLYSPLVVATGAWHEELKALARGCVTRHHSHHYLGFAATQWEMVQKGDALRVKPLLYVYRVLLTGIHLMQTGEVEANLQTLNERFRLPQVGELIERKVRGAEKEPLEAGEAALHEAEYARLVAELQRAAEESTLPAAPSVYEEMDDLLVRIRLGRR